MGSTLAAPDSASQCPVCDASARIMGYHPDAVLYRCHRCTHCFSVLKTKQGEQYGLDYYEEEHRRWFENQNFRLFERIAGFIPRDGKPRSVLDVGCGRGDFLRYLAAARPGLALTGIELTDVPPAEGIRYLKGSVLTTRVDGLFDAVVSLAVIEHVTEVKAFARRLAELCRPGGLICVMTVNEDSLLYDIARGFRRLGFPLAFDRLYSLHHVNHFTVRSLGELLAREQLEPVRVFTHNGLLAATDIPARSQFARGILRLGVGAIMALGWACGRMYLQTAVYRKPGDGAYA